VRLFASPERCRGMPEMCVVRDGAIFIVHPGVPLGWHIAFFGTYEPELRDVFRAVLPMGGVAVDVGANVGWHTMLMARLVGELGRVLAAEPNPSVRVRLGQHIELNRLQNIEIVPHALAEADGATDFQAPDADDPSAGDGHMVAPSEPGQARIVRIESRTLDTICTAARIERLDLIKIDVEGFEWPVLEGGKQMIARFRPHIVFEYIEEYSSRGGGTPQALGAFFARHRYRLYAVGRNWSELLDADRWPSSANVWAVPLSGAHALAGPA
jgi:FkbM family methyltransferase